METTSKTGRRCLGGLPPPYPLLCLPRLLGLTSAVSTLSHIHPAAALFSSHRRRPAKAHNLASSSSSAVASTSANGTSTPPVTTIRQTIKVATVIRTTIVKRAPPPPPPRVPPPKPLAKPSKPPASSKREGSLLMKKVAKKQAVKVVESSSEREESEESGEDAPVMQRASLSQVVERDVGATEDGNVECVTGEHLVLQNRAAYIEWFVDLSDMSRPAIEWAGTEIPTVVLEYPGTSATERVALLKPRVEGDEYDPIGDVVSVIRLVLDLYLTPAQSYSLFSHVPSTNSFASFLSAPPSRSATPSTPTDSSTVSAPLPSLIRTLEKAKAKKDGPGFLAAVERYNVGMRTLKAEGKVVENIKAMKGVQEKLWQKVVAQVYERAVGPEIEKLREYEAFSDNVYGELLPRFIADICQRTKVGPDSVFVDLGSGVGNCVVQAALATGCEAWGFENMAHASQLARLQVVEATARFRMWGIKGGAMHVVETDFCEAPEVVELLRRTDVVLVNNEVFSSGLNHRLSLLFLDLPSLASIVSLKAFASSFTLSAHNCLSPLAILDQGTEQSYPRKSVSWKDDGGSFWIAKVDRTKLENWTKKQVEREEKMKAAAVGDS